MHIHTHTRTHSHTYLYTYTHAHSRSHTHTHSHSRTHIYSHRSHFPSETVHVLSDHSDEVWYLKFSHNGTRLASGSRNGDIIIWNVGVSPRIVMSQIHRCVHTVYTVQLQKLFCQNAGCHVQVLSFSFRTLVLSVWVATPTVMPEHLMR